MFGLPSLGKLFLLVAAIALVWYGFRLYNRLEASRHDRERKSSRTALRHDMVECPRCGAYVAAGTRPQCERSDCPLA